MAAHSRWCSVALVCAAVSELTGCVTTGPYDGSDPADRYIRRKCETYAASDEYQSQPDPKLLFIWRKPDGMLECVQLVRTAMDLDFMVADVRARYTDSTFVASGNEILTHTPARSSQPSMSWSEVITTGLAAGNARNQELQQQIAANSMAESARASYAAEAAARSAQASAVAIAAANAQVQTQAAAQAKPTAAMQAAALAVPALPATEPTAAKAPSRSDPPSKATTGNSARRARSASSAPVVIRADQVDIKGEFFENINNVPAYAVKVRNRSSVPIDCDVTLRASFWTDSLRALNTLSGPGLAQIKVVRGSVSNLMPGSWGTALAETHLVQKSRIDYAIESCRTSEMYELSRKARN